MGRGLVLASCVIAGASLTACSKASEGDASAPADLFSAAAKPEDRFGSAFAERFRADPQSEPKNVRDGDLPPISLTTDPVVIN